MKYLAWLWHHSRGIRWNTVVRIVVGLGQVALGLLMVLFSKRFIDVTIRSGSTDDIIYMVSILVVTVVGGVMLRQVYFYLTTMATIRQVNVLRLKTFSNLFNRQLYDDKELHSGDITSRLAKDIDVVSDATTVTLPQMVITAIQLVGAFLLLHYFDARLAWALLVMTPMAIVFGKLIARRLRQMTHDIREDESRIQMHVQEGMENNAVLRSMGSEQWVTGRLDMMQQRLKGNVLRRTRFTVMTRLVLGCAFGLGYLLAFVWGGLGLRNGTITFGVMTSFLQLVSQIQHPILSLLNMIPQLIHATASIDRLQELVTEDKGYGRESQIGDADRYGVCITDVSFSYATGDHEVLSHFSYDFKPGSKTALMGETGIGKTTLFRLMLAFVKPGEGEIVVYSDMESYPVAEDTRPYFIFVPQGNTLMSGTIRYNLQLARPEATDDELCKVLHIACADFVNELPGGLDTELGERGSGLSEGQAQRIAIARGLLRPGTILLLDEISSSLDEQTEQTLYQRLFEQYPEKTMIFITHRTVVSNLCDEVIYLEPRHG